MIQINNEEGQVVFQGDKEMIIREYTILSSYFLSYLQNSGGTLQDAESLFRQQTDIALELNKEL